MSDFARSDDRGVTQVTFTLPAGYQWTTVEAALREAHNQEYELRMAFFWECQRLEEKVAALTKAGDAMALSLDAAEAINGIDGHTPFSVQSWRAAKEGKPS